ncbi:glycoside hydrolase family 3 C-terminal domain-containing protein [Spirillospora sp. CA-142024]|uniref:glycoside hydrolase family 3 C-terminal domain-containing protein n=1 Tax=Spirillospora sp. CA-142024 TaxID=3240036 RepID=UPI003D9440DB
MTDVTPRLNVQAILAGLTLVEKAELLDGSDFWHTQPVERLGVPAIMVTDGPHGLRKQAASADHLGLNASVPATCFPPAAGIASSWDPALMRRVGAALGDECRAAGVAVLLGPGVNMKRSPLCGRNFEYFSEDPALAGELAAAMVEGVQSRGVGTSVKHFAANNQETDRMTVSAEIDERTLREIYLPAFERVVTGARPWTVMCSYNKINGVYASESPWLLTDVLRRDWGYEGLVVSDWGAVNERDKAVAAGLDLEMPASGGVGGRTVLDAVRAGTLSEADVDQAVANVLGLVAKAQAREPLDGFDADAHHALAHEAALAGAVLLKNERGLLPLDPGAKGPVAVIGEFARSPRFQGAGSSQVNPTRVDSALDSLRTALDGTREVVFAPGFAIETQAADPALVDEAVRAAAAADVAIVFLGLPPSYESEGYDREHMDLPADQVALLRAVAAANPRVVVVLSNGSAVTVSDWEDEAQAVLEGWLLGQAGGAAIADLLLGVASPSGKLAETIPMRFQDNPTVGNFPGENGVVRYGEGLLIGYRWYDAHGLQVSYPFGHGLSYTSFAYSGFETEVLEDGASPRVLVRLTVENTGEVAGAEIVQLYVTDPQASVYRPEQELRAFARVALEPGQAKTVALELGSRAFAYWDTGRGHTGRGAWVVEGGEFGLRVGASSRDIRLSGTVVLSGDETPAPLGADSTAEDFLAHPAAGRWLRQRLEGTRMGARLLDGPHGRMMRAIPLVRLSRFPGAPFTEADLAEAARAFSPPA